MNVVMTCAIQNISHKILSPCIIEFMHEHYQSIKKSHLSLDLQEISLRELLHIPKSPCDVYCYFKKEKMFEVVIYEHAIIDNGVIKSLTNVGHLEFFIERSCHPEVILEIQKQLTQVTRSLSVGNATENVKHQMALLTIHMSYLYNNPNSDEIFSLQYQCAKNLAYFLIKNINYHEVLYKEFLKQNHHYIYAQPLIASLFTLGLLKYSKKYNDQEIESLFITSYFKDIGMCTIPESKFDSDNLSSNDKSIMAKHAEISVQMLKNRLPLAPHHFLIIENHHSFSLLQSNFDITPKSKNDVDTVSGFETVIVSAMDIIAAAIHGRPFREPIKIFDALNLIKNLIVDRYPQEFKLMVGYFKKFFFDR